MNIKDVIAELCKEQGITLSQFEKDNGFAPRSVYKWEHSSPSIDRLIKAADYLGTTVDYLVERGGHKYNLSKLMSDDPSVISIYRARQKMSDGERRKMDDLLKIAFSEAFGDIEDDKS